jgi:hypothetical protein
VSVFAGVYCWVRRLYALGLRHRPGAITPIGSRACGAASSCACAPLSLAPTCVSAAVSPDSPAGARVAARGTACAPRQSRHASAQLTQYPNSAPPSLAPAAFAEKQGGGTSLFGGKSWKKRYFVVNTVEKTLAYFDNEQGAAGKPLKPAIKLEGYKLTHPEGATGNNWEVSRAVQH